jgi:hypothetical protein
MRGAGRVDLAVEGIGDAADVPTDAEGPSTTTCSPLGCAACGAEPSGTG